MEESLLSGANRKHLGSASFTTTLAAIVSFRRNSSRTIGRRISRLSRRRERAGGRAGERARACPVDRLYDAFDKRDVHK